MAQKRFGSFDGLAGEKRLDLQSIRDRAYSGDHGHFGTVPDFIVDLWVDNMIENKKWDENRLATIISDRHDNPFSLKETTESPDADWDGTTEVLNSVDAGNELLNPWA